MLKNLIISATVLIASTAMGHVQLLTPVGNDVLHVGSVVEVSWRITIPHDTQNWDLYLSTTGQKGPWKPIALDLPLGDNSQGSVHTYNWTVPNMPSDNVWIRVVQDNLSGDYDDTNDQACSIVAKSSCDGDINQDDFVNVADLLAVIDQWGMS